MVSLLKLINNDNNNVLYGQTLQGQSMEETTMDFQQTLKRAVFNHYHLGLSVVRNDHIEINIETGVIL